MEESLRWGSYDNDTIGEVLASTRTETERGVTILGCLSYSCHCPKWL